MIDFTDNDIRVLGNLPKLQRLKGLLLSRNRISHIQPAIASTLPNLESLVLTANSLSRLADLDALAEFSNLTHLILLDNPVTSQQHYRSYVLWRCRSLRVLDFEKVKTKEREYADKLFGSPESPTPLALQIMGSKSVAIIDGTLGEKQMLRKLTEEDKENLRQTLKKASSLAEIEKIENALKSGYI